MTNKLRRPKLTQLLQIVVALVIVGAVAALGIRISRHSHAQTAVAQPGNQQATIPQHSSALCGFKPGSGAASIRKVMLIWEENKGYTSIVNNSAAPYFNKVIAACGLATNYYAYTHPSLPNYMAPTSGLSYAHSPWNSDCSPTQAGCTTSADSIFSQLGSNWRSYSESMPANCYRHTTPLYAPRHSPAVYYTAVAAACAKQDVPLGTTSSGNLLNDIHSGLPALSTVTPNINDDMHNGTIQQGDAWMQSWLPIITSGSDYQNGKLAILIVWDEGGGSGNVASHTIAIALSAYTRPGTTPATRFNDFSVLRTMEDITGQPPLGLAGTAPSMKTAFNL